MKKVLFIFPIFLYLCLPISADELSDLKAMMQSMQEQMTVMQERIKILEEEKEFLEKDPNLQARVENFEKSKSQTGIGIVSKLNPDFSVMGDFVYHATDEDGGELDNDFSFREVELAISASVDSYARGDFFIAIENEDGETEIALEEGYLTLLQTPIENFQGKFGKFRPYFGKANKMHLHALPWTTYPSVIQNFLGEEGFSEAGVSLNYLIPNPVNVFSEITFEAFNNNDAAVLGAGEEGEVVYLSHLKNFFELNDHTTFELGGSFMGSDNGNGGGSNSYVSGFDITLNTRLLDKRKTISHTEALFSKVEQLAEDDIDAWGMFTSLEQQLTDRWWVFSRYDFSQMPTDSADESHAYSAGLTFAQSEYAFWRVMFTHTDNNISDDANEVWLQLNFGLGPHRPHQYR